MIMQEGSIEEVQTSGDGMICESVGFGVQDVAVTRVVVDCPVKKSTEVQQIPLTKTSERPE